MPFEYSKLQGKIKEVYGTQGEFAAAMGVSSVSLSDKLNNKSNFTQPQINKACELLGIRTRDIPLYFFNIKVKEP